MCHLDDWLQKMMDGKESNEFVILLNVGGQGSVGIAISMIAESKRDLHLHDMKRSLHFPPYHVDEVPPTTKVCPI